MQLFSQKKPRRTRDVRIYIPSENGGHERRGDDF